MVSVSFGFEIKTKVEQNIEDVFKASEDNMYKRKLFESSSIRNKTIELISETLFEKNKREADHSKRVAVLVVMFAKKLGLSPEHIDILRVAGLMHDIGKIGIDESILNKKGLLTEKEYKEIKRNPEIGFRILSSVNDYSEIATCVLQHHERWDGTGYPQRLKSDDICLDARIITLCDAYDAMTSERSYREKRSKKEAIQELIRCSGMMFDPNLVNIFVAAILNQGE